MSRRNFTEQRLQTRGLFSPNTSDMMDHDGVSTMLAAIFDHDGLIAGTIAGNNSDGNEMADTRA